MTAEELERLADAIGPRYRALVLVAGVVGLRWSEAIGLRVCDINFLHHAIHVRQTISEVEGRLDVADTKTRASRRTISVPQFLLYELSSHLTRERRREAENLVFTGPKGARWADCPSLVRSSPWRPPAEATVRETTWGGSRARRQDSDALHSVGTSVSISSA